MTSTVSLREQWGALLEPLHEALRGNDAAAFRSALDALTGLREHQLWQELRQLEARLRSALEQFRLDPGLLRIASTEMPDARARLDHVLHLTEEAAHRTMDLVERSAPLAARTAATAGELAAELGAVRAQADAEPQWLARIEAFLADAQRDGDAVRANLAEVLLAQSYQDLSGQIIRRVIQVVSELESELARLLHVTGGPAPESRHTAQPPAGRAHGFGPAIPGVSTDTVDGQQDVDALLADGMAMRGMA